MLLDPLFRRIIRHGELIITDAAGRAHHYGAPDPDRAPVHLCFHDKRVPLDIVRKPALGVAEAYMEGRLDVGGDDILALLDLYRSNARWEDTIDDGLGVGEHPWIMK